MASRDRKRSLFHPAVWPAWIGILLFKPLCRLPWALQLRCGRVAGRLFYHVIRLRRRVVAANLNQCFPELSEESREVLAAAHYEAMGMGIFETGVAWWAPRDKLPASQIEGAEHLERAIATGRGVILLTAHFTTLEICGRIFADKYPMGGLYREPDNPVIAREMRRGRIDKLIPAIQMNDIRGLIRALKQGHTIWYAPDQGRRGKFSAILPFFGVPALTNTATSRLATMTGASVVPFFGTRKPDGSYLLSILPALENFPSEDPDADAERINRLMENEIRKAPEQYFWIHRRFKRRGRDFEDIYK